MSTLMGEGSQRINGVRLYYKTMGVGEPIVIVHGGPGLSHFYFLPQMAELAKTNRLIFYDQRAHGRSEAPRDTNAMQIDNFVEDLDGIRAAFKLKEMNLLAHSWGTLIALKYAIKYPTHVRSLILVSPVAPNEEYRVQASRVQSARMSRQDSVTLAAIMKTAPFRQKTQWGMEQYFRTIFRTTMYDRDDVDKITLLFQPDYAAKSRMLRYMGDEALHYDLFPELSAISAPTLIVQGDADGTPPEAIEQLRDSITQARLITLKKCGHFPYIEQPSAFFSDVRKFLKQH